MLLFLLVVFCRVFPWAKFSGGGQKKIFRSTENLVGGTPDRDPLVVGGDMGGDSVLVGGDNFFSGARKIFFCFWPEKGKNTRSFLTHLK